MAWTDEARAAAAAARKAKAKHPAKGAKVISKGPSSSLVRARQSLLTKSAAARAHVYAYGNLKSFHSKKK